MTVDWDEVCRYLGVRDPETARRIAYERVMALKRTEAERKGIPLDELLADEEERKRAVLARFVRTLRGERA